MAPENTRKQLTLWNVPKNSKPIGKGVSRQRTDLILLETFASEEFLDVSLNQWLRRVPSEMLKAHLNIDKEMGFCCEV